MAFKVAKGLINGYIYSSDFDYSDDTAFLPWMSISDQDLFSVNATIATAVGPTVRPSSLTSTPTTHHAF